MAEHGKCSICGEGIDPATAEDHVCDVWRPPRAPLEAASWCWEDDELVISVDAHIPVAGCWICGRSERVRARMRRFMYSPPWLYFLLPTVIGVAIALVFQPRARLDLPICLRCIWRWRVVDVAVAVFAVVGIPLLAFFPGLVIADALGLWGMPRLGVVCGVAVAGWLVVLAGLKAAWIDRTQIRCERIAGGEVTLRFPDSQRSRDAIGSGRGLARC